MKDSITKSTNFQFYILGNYGYLAIGLRRNHHLLTFTLHHAKRLTLLMGRVTGDLAINMVNNVTDTLEMHGHFGSFQGS
jgi:hypothetical protein